MSRESELEQMSIMKGLKDDFAKDFLLGLSTVQMCPEVQTD